MVMMHTHKLIFKGQLVQKVETNATDGFTFQANAVDN